MSSTGKIIGYLPGWNTPPSAQNLASAGYTHVIVAFGVFDLNTPGNIVSAFSTITSQYISSLHALGLKVLLSIGGASTSISSTTVNFHQAVKLASSFTVFENNFINSINNLSAQYGFDGM